MIEYLAGYPPYVDSTARLTEADQDPLSLSLVLVGVGLEINPDGVVAKENGRNFGVQSQVSSTLTFFPKRSRLRAHQPISLGLADSLDRDFDSRDLAANLSLQLLRDILVRLEELLGLLAALAQSQVSVVEPGARLGHHV